MVRPKGVVSMRNCYVRITENGLDFEVSVDYQTTQDGIDDRAFTALDRMEFRAYLDVSCRLVYTQDTAPESLTAKVREAIKARIYEAAA